MIVSYVQIALREPNLFQFLYMNSDSSAALSAVDSLKSDNSYGELVKKLSASYQVSAEKIGRYLQHTIVYTHGIAALVVAGTMKASEEEVLRMIDYAVSSFCMREDNMKSKKIGKIAGTALKAVALSVDIAVMALPLLGGIEPDARFRPARNIWLDFGMHRNYLIFSRLRFETACKYPIRSIV